MTSFEIPFSYHQYPLRGGKMIKTGGFGLINALMTTT